MPAQKLGGNDLGIGTSVIPESFGTNYGMHSSLVVCRASGAAVCDCDRYADIGIPGTNANNTRGISWSKSLASI
jgi:hypothetical protein